MVRDALALVRLLNRETRDDPAAGGRRADQRAHGDTIWELRDGLVSEDLREVLPHASADGIPGYDAPIPMEGAEDDGGPEVPTRLMVLRVG